ncbi:MAG: MoxR family ATPase [Victivallaceae bacterium]|nr:MoxR family ATPase [Victivallaceae bacterium]
MENMDIQALQQLVRSKSAALELVKTEIGRIVSGQEHLVKQLILAMIANGHVLLEGVPGLAKTLAVRTLAGTLDGSFSRLQFPPDLLPADLIGTRIYDVKTGEFSTKIGPVYANFVLADEINRAPAKVQSALLECMQERQITIAGESTRLPDPFLVLATQNPIEQEGTYPLPEAQLDRFMFKVKVDYPSRAEEMQVVEHMAHTAEFDKPVAVATLDEIRAAREIVDKIYIDEKIIEYILDIITAARPGKLRDLSARQSEAKLDSIANYIEYGPSPRGSINLALAARGNAFLAGRAYVVPQDVKDVAFDVLRHRLILTYEAEAENLTTDDVIAQLLDELRTP